MSKMYFRLKKDVGTHAETDPETKKPVIYEAKDGVVFSSENDLAAKFPAKFERVETPGETPAPAKVDEPVEPKELAAADPVKTDEPKADEDNTPVNLGEDVTAKFESAKEQDFKVFYKVRKGHFVTEADNLSVPLNKKKLNKVDVEGFIKEYLDKA